MPDNAREIFVRNLRYLMNARGISQADICRELGMSSTTVSDWCTGKKYPRVDAMQRLADLLGVLFSTLTTEGGLQDFEDQQRLEDLHQNTSLRILFDRSRKMKHEDVDKIIQVVDLMFPKESDIDG
jgi:transcriptional regulator with XRE-family HTH domain